MNAYFAIKAIKEIAVITPVIRYKLAQQKRRDEIKAEASAQIEALNIAAAVMIDRIERGEYDGKTIDDLITDMEFITIAKRF